VLKKGDTGYIVENNNKVTQVHILACSGNLYTIKLNGGAIRLPKHRIFTSEEDANNSLMKNNDVHARRHKSPYDYM